MTTIENMDIVIDAVLGRLLIEVQELLRKGKISKAEAKIRRRDVHRFMLKVGIDKVREATAMEIIEWKKGEARNK